MEDETEPTLEDLEATRAGLLKTLNWLDEKIKEAQQDGRSPSESPE